ncbi:MAG: hypothetical protein U1E87_06515 [Alphaproteobacteria bacterium]
MATLATTAAGGGARWVGFVFISPSPRAVSLDQAAALRRLLPPEVKAVALIVDGRDRSVARIQAAVAPDLFQLHGQEGAKRVARSVGTDEAAQAIGIARPEDLTAVGGLSPSPTISYSMPNRRWVLLGGSGTSFDWTFPRRPLPRRFLVPLRRP